MYKYFQYKYFFFGLPIDDKFLLKNLWDTQSDYLLSTELFSNVGVKNRTPNHPFKSFKTLII
jgi:hypothetical protein